MNLYYLGGLTIGGLVGVYLFSLLFRYAILGRGGTKVQHLWVVMLTGVVAIGFSAFGDGTDGFSNRITNPPDMAQAIAYALSALIVAFFVWLRSDTNMPPEGSPATKASIVGRALALVFVIPMILIGLGNLAGSAYSVAVHGQPSPGLGVNRAEMREIMLNGEMAPFWQLVDQEAPSDLDYIIERIFSDEESYMWRPAFIIGSTCNHRDFWPELFASIERAKPGLFANEPTIFATSLQSSGRTHITCERQSGWGSRP